MSGWHVGASRTGDGGAEIAEAIVKCGLDGADTHTSTPDALVDATLIGLTGRDTLSRAPGWKSGKVGSGASGGGVGGGEKCEDNDDIAGDSCSEVGRGDRRFLSSAGEGGPLNAMAISGGDLGSVSISNRGKALRLRLAITRSCSSSSSGSSDVAGE